MFTKQKSKIRKIKASNFRDYNKYKVANKMFSPIKLL